MNIIITNQVATTGLDGYYQFTYQLGPLCVTQWVWTSFTAPLPPFPTLPRTHASTPCQCYWL